MKLVSSPLPGYPDYHLNNQTQSKFSLSHISRAYYQLHVSRPCSCSSIFPHLQPVTRLPGYRDRLHVFCNEAQVKGSVITTSAQICIAEDDAGLTLYVNAVCSCRDGGLNSPSTGTLFHVLEAVRKEQLS